MKAPTLVIMAAGMGSRFGGSKQITPVDPEGHAIIDFSLYDAWRAGFRKVAFIIKREMEAEFRRLIGDRMEAYFEVSYVFQELTRLPEGYSVPEERTKPWGTAHAVACCEGIVDGPFAAINADDFYGRSAFETIYRFLTTTEGDHRYAMVGYRLKNTVTENGSVSRGVCQVENGMLVDIVERTKIFQRSDRLEYTEDGETFTELSGDCLVSMNLWGFTGGMLEELWKRMPAFLDKGLAENPLKCEYFLPFVVNEQLVDGTATAAVLPCEEAWYGITYREDLEQVCQAIARMKEAGVYTQQLWG